MSDITLTGDGSTSSDPAKKKVSTPSASTASGAKPARLDAEGIKKEISQLNSSPDGLVDQHIGTGAVVGFLRAANLASVDVVELSADFIDGAAVSGDARKLCAHQ